MSTCPKCGQDHGQVGAAARPGVRPTNTRTGNPGSPQVNKEPLNIVQWTAKIRPVGRCVAMITYRANGDWQAKSGIIGQWDPTLAELLSIALVGKGDLTPSMVSVRWPNVNAFVEEVGAPLFLDDVSVVGRFLGTISNSAMMDHVRGLWGFVK